MGPEPGADLHHCALTPVQTPHHTQDLQADDVAAVLTQERPREREKSERGPCWIQIDTDLFLKPTRVLLL